MKKTLVAVAALVATGAFAEVTVGGVMEAAISSTAGTTTLIGGTNGSEIQFNVSEDLGNGLKAVAGTALLHSLTSPDHAGGAGAATATAGQSAAYAQSNGAVTAYNSFIGLTGEFGSVKIGQQFSNTFLTSAVGDVHGRSGISNYVAGGATGQVANSLNYTSPSFSGVSLSYQQVIDSTAAKYYSYSLNYSNGGLNAGYAAAKNGAVDEQVLAASYNFGMATVHVGSGTYTGEKNSVGYGVSVPYNAFTFSLGASDGFAFFDGANATKQMVQVKYDLSKRTNLYYAYRDNNTTKTTDNIVGVRHNF